MLKRLAKLSPRFKRYLIIGISVYLFELAVIVIAQAFGQSVTVAVGLSFWLGLIVSFLMQKFVAFEDKRLTHRILIPQVIAYCLLVLFNFGFTVAVAALLSPPIPATICRTLALAATTTWNFYLYKTHIFSGSGPLFD